MVALLVLQKQHLTLPLELEIVEHGQHLRVGRSTIIRTEGREAQRLARRDHLEGVGDTDQEEDQVPGEDIQDQRTLTDREGHSS